MSDGRVTRYITVATPHRGPRSISKTIGLSGDKLVTKTFDGGDGAQVAMLPCAWWKLEKRPFQTFQDLALILTDAAEDGGSCMIRGTPTEDRLPRVPRDNQTVTGWGNFVAFDIDSAPFPPGVATFDIQAIGLAFRAVLPAMFQTAGVVVQLTGSHGVKPDVRLRLWFGTDAPLSRMDLFTVFESRKPALNLPWSATPFPLDVTVWRPVQPNFTAAPVFEDGAVDPVPQRMFVIDGDLVKAPSAAYLSIVGEVMGFTEAARGDVNPDCVFDSPGVLKACQGLLAKRTREGGLDAGGRHVGLASLAFAMRDFGRSWDGVKADLIEWAAKPCVDAHTKETRPNVDPAIDPEEIDSHLDTWEGSYKGTPGNLYDAKYEPTNPFGAVVEDDEEDEPQADSAPKVDKRLAWSFGSNGLRQQSKWLIQGVAPQFDVGALIGPTRAGKSFGLVSMFASLASGSPWLKDDWKVMDGQHGCLILAAEAADTVEERVAGIIQQKNLDPNLPLWVLGWNNPDPAELTATIRLNQKAMLERTGVKLDIVGIDTLSRMFAIQDENSNAEANAIIKLLYNIGKKLGVRIIFVHHTGKNVMAGARGADAWTASIDYQITFSGTTDPITGAVTDRGLALTKTKRGETRYLGGVTLDKVKIGTDEQTGEDWETAVVRLLDRPAPAAAAKPATRADENDRWTLAALVKLGTVSRAALVLRLKADHGLSQATAYRVIGGLIERGQATEDEKRNLTAVAVADDGNHMNVVEDDE